MLSLTHTLQVSLSLCIKGDSSGMVPSMNLNFDTESYKSLVKTPFKLITSTSNYLEMVKSVEYIVVL